LSDLRAERLSSGAEILVTQARIRSGLSPATNFIRHNPNREADLRAKRLASGAEILLAQAKIHSGVE
jgi:hypothetical protein